MREEFLNSDLSLNGHGLSHNDLRSRLATILRKMILVYDPIYKPIVMEESENLISNFRTSRPLRCDISVSMSFNNFIKPFLVGEVKEGKELFNNLIDVLKQLLGYQIILERPYSTDEEEGVNFLLGFATDNYTFVLLELAIRDWLSPDLISVVRCIQINRQQNNEYFHAQCFQYLLDKSIHSVPQLLDNTFRYRLYGVSALSHCNVVKLPFSVLNEDFLISLMDTNELSYTNIRLLSTIKQEDFVILKVSGSFFSGGVRNYEKFIKLLNAIKNIPIGMQNSMLMTLDQLYVKVFRLTAPSNLIVSIMNYSLNSCDCECGFLQQFWNVDRDLRNNFYYDVYCVATDAITQNVFHWDIRRANILVLTNKRFRVIDWESVEFLDNADSIKLANARLNISKLTLHNCSIFVNLDFLLRPALFILESILRCVKL